MALKGRSPRSLFRLVFVAVVRCVLISAAIAQQDSPAADPGTDPAELAALFDVLEGMNAEVDWKSVYPDPCLNYVQGMYCLPDDIAGMYHITNLEFGFLSDFEDTIPCSEGARLHPSIARLPYLESLQVFNCFVNGSASIPKELGRLSNSLQLLTFQGNPGLQGAIPAEIGNLMLLQRLVIAANNVSGPIPQELGSLVNLLQLDLSSNLLEGTIPEALGQLRSLVILDVGDNSLSGNLPSLGGLLNLRQMVLSHNHFNGAIPEDLGLLSTLTYLDLSFNNLTGGVPQSFVGLKQLQDLFLESNDMRSSLPGFLGAMSSLSRLTFAQSRFIGEIPSSLGQLENLRVLVLRGNELSGRIPAVLGGLPHIYQLDLSENNLTGAVPFTSEFVKKMGSNLLVLNNSGLCFPHGIVRVAVESTGVSICSENTSANGGLEVLSPSSDLFGPAPEPGAAPDDPSLVLNLSVAVALALWSHFL